MRYYTVDPENTERLLKIPPHVVDQIRADEREAAAQRVAAMDYTTLHEGWGGYIVDALGDEWVLKSAAIAALRATP